MGAEMVIRAISKGRSQPDERNARAGTRLLWDKLDAIRSPILLIGGGAEEALLKPEHVEKYRQHCQNLEVAIFHDSGHMVWQPDYDRFINRVNKFLDYIDDQRSR